MKINKDYQLNWGKIYDGGDAHTAQIIKDLYEEGDLEELHVALWSWLSLDGTREEYEWFDAFGIPKVRNHCFACEMAELSFDCLPKWVAEEIDEEDKPPFCHCCPLTDSSAEECLDGLYGKWLGTYFEEREGVAMEIASMEWKRATKK